ncbi:MAG: hypothetical protein SXV54_15135 [Chloroflexota bacterium]|nr:hypothetical protein [Chloroflexota bacterium]
MLRKFEQRYWISSDDFYELYSQGRLDDGQHREGFSEWAGYYKIKLKREAALQQLSQQRLERLRSQATAGIIDLYPSEPAPLARTSRYQAQSQARSGHQFQCPQPSR